MSPVRRAAGDLVALAIAAALLPAATPPLGPVLFPLVTVALLLALGAYGPPTGPWEGLAALLAVTGGLAAIALGAAATGSALDPRTAAALWACAAAAVRAGQVAPRPRSRRGPSPSPRPQ